MLHAFFSSPDIDRREAELPDVRARTSAARRYSLERMKASFEGVTLETTREDLLSR